MINFVRVERPRDAVALVTLDRPERMNSMAFDVMIPLRDALRELSADNTVRVVVLTGASRTTTRSRGVRRKACLLPSLVIPSPTMKLELLIAFATVRTCKSLVEKSLIVLRSII